MSDQKLFEELVRVASENPGAVQDALLPVLQEYQKSASQSKQAGPSYGPLWDLWSGSVYTDRLSMLKDFQARLENFHRKNGRQLPPKAKGHLYKAVETFADFMVFLENANHYIYVNM